MKNPNMTIQQISEILVTRNSKELAKLRTSLIAVQSYSFPQKVIRRGEKPKIRHRVYPIQRMEDNTLRCIQTYRKLPETSEGTLDVAQLHLEILLER